MQEMGKGAIISALVLMILFFIVGSEDLRALEIFPEVVGNGASDSIICAFETFDTTALPCMANPDSLKILRFNSVGTLVDSLGENDPRVMNIRTGSFEVHLKSADSQGHKGKYIIRVYAFKGGQIRGAASGGYYVREDNWDSLDTIRVYAKAILDTLQDGFSSQSNQHFLDALISSRSTLTTSDNIGINWADINNTLAVQYLPNSIFGGVASVINPVNVDTAKIARSVWDDDLVGETNRTVDLSSCQGGSGAYACSLYVCNAADSSAFQGVLVRILNSNQSATEALGVTDPNGLVVAALDASVYKVWVYQAGIVFEEQPFSIEVMPPSVRDTIWGSRFDPGAPVSPELCRVYGWIYDLSGRGLSNVTVTARIAEMPLRYQGAIISSYYKSAESDSAGYWQIDLFPNARLEPDDTKYEFMIFYQPGRIIRKIVNVPALSSWELDW